MGAGIPAAFALAFTPALTAGLGMIPRRAATTKGTFSSLSQSLGDLSAMVAGAGSQEAGRGGGFTDARVRPLAKGDGGGAQVLQAST